MMITRYNAMKTTGEVRVALILGALILVALTAALAQGGTPFNGLQLTLSLEQAQTVQSKVPIRVELRNVGVDDLVLNVGFMLANGKKQYPDAVVLTLTDSLGKSRLLSPKGPAGIAGRVDPLIVGLPVGSAFSIPVDLDNYLAAASKEWDYKPKPGTYFLEAQFTGKRVTRTNLDTQGIALMPYWEGTITSNRLRFEVPSQ